MQPIDLRTRVVSALERTDVIFGHPWNGPVVEMRTAEAIAAMRVFANFLEETAIDRRRDAMNHRAAQDTGNYKRCLVEARAHERLAVVIRSQIPGEKTS